MKRVYENEKLRVHWDSDKCFHAANCTQGLPGVFDVNKRPWIDVDAADAEEIKRVIDSCPSGALTYEVPGETEEEGVSIQVLQNGPYKVKGQCQLLSADGEVIPGSGVFALCRCGHSKRMPFCDGSHILVSFRDIPENQ